MIGYTLIGIFCLAVAAAIAIEAIKDFGWVNGLKVLGYAFGLVVYVVVTAYCLHKGI